MYLPFSSPERHLRARATRREAQEAEDLRLATRLQAEENAAAARDTSAAFVRTSRRSRARAPVRVLAGCVFRCLSPRISPPRGRRVQFAGVDRDRVPPVPRSNFTEQPLTYEDMLDLIERLVVGGDPGVRPEQMARMPTRIYRRTPGGEPPCCSVCLCDAEDGDEIRTLPCAHEFHARCVDRWLSEHRTCPMCKMDVTEAGGAR